MIKEDQMMRIKKALFCILVVVILLPLGETLAQSQNYIDDVLEALRSNPPVYVAPGTEGTNLYTADDLRKSLREDDNIVLIMLPEEALTGTDMLTLVMAISQGLDDQKTIGLAVGQEVIGYSLLLPVNVATNEMKNADSISNGARTALSVFARNIHLWQMNYGDQPLPTVRPTSTPDATPTPKPTPKPLSAAAKKSIGIGASSFFGLVALIVIIVMIKKLAPKLDKRQRELNSIEEAINELEPLINQIQNNRLGNELAKAYQAALGLLEIMRQSKVPLGYTEANLPTLISNLRIQIVAILGHQSGRHPLPRTTYDELVEVMSNYDDLFIQLQYQTPKAVKLMESIISSTNAMISSMGYLQNDQK